MRFLASVSGKEVEIIALGKRARDFFKKQGFQISMFEQDLLRRSSYAELEAVAHKLQQSFLSGQFDEIHIFSNEFKSALLQNPVSMQFLPFVAQPAPATSSRMASYILEPEANELLNSLVPMLVNFRFYRVLIEAIASEHAARMAAMDSATGNAKDMIGRLTLQMNRARQAAITKELMEIVGGAEAISA